ncbi:hypothetical protein NMG46_02590 [Mesorhizobium sp. LMG 17147]|uniref:hypothetical protein n=1 Tax=Mesorhizobium sp. LMG 17147 TaxID=2963091 RepID=UPI0020C9C732|nr:hypothetical protein [Mesorhizobium sp. LMG 17147]MCP9229141.1 hypothetical protein [Mesorhizobium sp. LMG 17147]
MALSTADLYKAHVLNLRAVHAGIVHTERELRAAIARQDNPSAGTLIRILLLLTGAWAECRLKKLLYEPSGFDDLARKVIFDKRSQIESWQASLEMGYRKRYNVPKAKLSEQTLRPTALMRYRALADVISSELAPVFEMRNTLAHGQWSRPLNSEETDISGPMIALIKKENALSIRFKLSLLDALAMLIHDLVASPATFERDYDRHFERIVSTKRNLKTRMYGDWEAQMISKYKRGKDKIFPNKSAGEAEISAAERGLVVNKGLKDLVRDLFRR